MPSKKTSIVTVAAQSRSAGWLNSVRNPIVVSWAMPESSPSSGAYTGRRSGTILLSRATLRRAIAAAEPNTTAGEATTRIRPVPSAARRKPRFSIVLWVTFAAESSCGVFASSGSIAASAGA